MLGIDFMDKNKIIPLKDLEEDSQRLESTLEKTVRKLRELMRAAGAAFCAAALSFSIYSPLSFIPGTTTWRITVSVPLSRSAF